MGFQCLFLAINRREWLFAYTSASIREGTSATRGVEAVYGVKVAVKSRLLSLKFYFAWGCLSKIAFTPWGSYPKVVWGSGGGGPTGWFRLNGNYFGLSRLIGWCVSAAMAHGRSAKLLI